MRMLLPDRIPAMSPTQIADAHEWPGRNTWVRAVMVSTADGAARSPQGSSDGISTSADRLLLATLRGLADVILVGAGTARGEGYGPVAPRPELAARRRAADQAPTARIAVVTRSGDLDTTSALFTAGAAPIVIAPEDIDPNLLTRLRSCSDVISIGCGSADLGAALRELAALGLTRVCCEGGPTLLGQLAADDLLDELCLTVTPLLAGGAYGDGNPISRILAGPPLQDSPRDLRLAHVLEDDGTLFLRYRFRPIRRS